MCAVVSETKPSMFCGWLEGARAGVGGGRGWEPVIKMHSRATPHRPSGSPLCLNKLVLLSVYPTRRRFRSTSQKSRPQKGRPRSIGGTGPSDRQPGRSLEIPRPGDEDECEDTTSMQPHFSLTTKPKKYVRWARCYTVTRRTRGEYPRAM